MFEAILFDFDGTLVDFVDSDIQSLRWLHSNVGSPVCFEDFLETAVDEIMAFHQLVEADKINPLLMHEFRLKRTFARHNITWRDHYVNFYRNKLIETCVSFPGVPRMLFAAKQKTKTGLVTNAYDGKEQRKRINHASLAAYFDTIVVAGEIGVYKPDPAIFLHSLDCLDAAPENSLFIGDSVTHDITGAKLAGMKTILFNNHSIKNSDAADYTVAEVEELQNLLNQLI